MATFDVVAIAVLAVSCLIGVITRAAWQLFLLISMLAAYGLALFANPYLVDQVGEGWEWADRGLMFVALLAAAALLVLLLAYFAGGIAKIKLKKGDRAIGGLAGLINGMLLCVLVASFLLCFSIPGRKAVTASTFGRGAGWTVEFIPNACLPRWWANYEVFKEKNPNAESPPGN